MVINKVLLYPSTKKTVRESDLGAILRCLESSGIKAAIYDGVSFPDCDAVIALGGDGTMLAAARLAWTHDKLLLGINFGRLGYMSGLEISEIDMLKELKSGVSIETRMLIDIKAVRDGVTIASDTALNEAVISRTHGGGIASLELKCDGARVCSYRADGLIIATPTGSSAYALSAGGPIIDTKLDAFCVCAVCPHTMGVRALVFSPNSVLEVNASSYGNIPCSLTADGRTVCSLEGNDIVIAERSPKTLRLIRLKKDAFYDVLYKKLS